MGKTDPMAGPALSFDPFVSYNQMQTIPPVMALMEEMRSGISTYLGAAGTILRPGGVNLKPAPDDYFSMEKNFFSMLFLYSFHRAGISRSHRR
ncbi:MAG: hypothetical protein DSY90_00740, partial [Deltaproteobacteria bacterium]